MRAVLQRVSQAEVSIEGGRVGKIGQGLLVYLGVGKGDSSQEAEYIADKLVNLRIFRDEGGKMNLSIMDIGGSILLVSNFTLYGNCVRGRRPGFDASAEAGIAEELYEKVATLIGERGVTVEKGGFGAYMQVESVNDGPVTFLLDSSKDF